MALITMSSVLAMGDIRPAFATSAYASTILADSPSLYWRLGESPGATSIIDSSTHNANSVLSGSPTFGVAGAPVGDSDTAAGMSGAYAYTSSSYVHSNVFTVETWFKTSSNLGGTLISFCDNGSNTDRAIWMDNAGKLVFGVYPATIKTITSTSSYNNGAWHMAAATLGPAGMILYVDGKQVAIDASTTTAESANERWRVGADTNVINGFPDHATNLGLSGQQDEAAVWATTALTATQIRNHYSAALYGAQASASVTIDPSFSFGVAGQATTTTCNGVAGSTVATSSSAVSFGHFAAGSQAFGVQQLQVSSNAGGGYVVYLQSTSATSPVLVGINGHVIADAGALGPVPSAGSEFFGYSTDSSTAALGLGQIKSVPTNAGNDVVASGTTGPNQTNCVVYVVGTAPSTPADAYSAVIVYTAIPSF